MVPRASNSSTTESMITAMAQCLVLTFNCGREPVKPTLFGKHISNALKNGPAHDILVVSIQEICPLAHAFLGGTSMSFYYQKLNEAVVAATGERTYTNICTKNLGITAIIIYVRQDRKGYIGSVESTSTGVGWLEVGNKGAVGVKLSWLAGPGRYIDLTFVAAHLAPHEPGVERRNQDWMHIVQRLVFERVWISNKRLEALQREESASGNLGPGRGLGEREPLLGNNMDSSLSGNKEASNLSTVYTPMAYIFIAGDLNYRTAATGPRPEDYAKYPKFPDSSDSIKQLFSNDQLTAELKAGRTLHGFKESKIHFPPTYKYSSAKQQELEAKEDDGTFEEYLSDPKVEMGYAQHRWPSWCDRILYLSPFVEPHAREAKLTINFYKSLPLMSTSDHQPVIASFLIPPDRTVSATDERIASLDDYRIHAPFPVDPLWHEKFVAARRMEFAVGVAAFLGLTWRGNSILLAVILGVVGAVVVSNRGMT